MEENFGEFAPAAFWRVKRESNPPILLNNYIFKNWRVKFGEFQEFAKFTKVFLRQSFALYGIPQNNHLNFK